MFTKRTIGTVILSSIYTLQINNVIFNCDAIVSITGEERCSKHLYEEVSKKKKDCVVVFILSLSLVIH